MFTKHDRRTEPKLNYFLGKGQSFQIRKLSWVRLPVNMILSIIFFKDIWRYVMNDQVYYKLSGNKDSREI